MYDLGFHNGTAVIDGRLAEVNVHVADGRIAHVGPERHRCREVVDAHGLHVLPGMVDAHVHLMDPGSTEREDFPSGTAAAVVNGVTTVLEHTHAHPVRVAADLVAKREHLSGRSHADFGLVAHSWPGAVGEAADAWGAGATYFKLFTCETHGLPAHGTASLLDFFTEFRRLGAPCLVHCEDDDLTAAGERRLRAAGRRDGALIGEWRSHIAEQVAVAEVVVLARHAGARVGIAHCSSPDVADLIQRERGAGDAVVAEACPQYFVLREDEALEHGALRKFTPPVRARDDGDEAAMWSRLRDGALAYVASDHAPSTMEQKCSVDLWGAPFGLPGLDTTMALLLDAVADGRLTLADLVRVYSTAPARRYGLRGKGALAVGADGDVCLVDLSRTRTLRGEEMRSKAGWTPYEGRTVRGDVVGTWLRGRRVAQDGDVHGPPQGRFQAGPGGRR